MSDFWLGVDKIMCFHWMLTYTLVLVSTWQYKCPIRPLTFAFFVTKIVGDFIGGLVYFNQAGVFIAIISFFLPALDLVFIIVAIYRKKNEEKYNMLYNKIHSAISDRFLPRKLKIPKN